MQANPGWWKLDDSSISIGALEQVAFNKGARLIEQVGWNRGIYLRPYV